VDEKSHAGPTTLPFDSGGKTAVFLNVDGMVDRKLDLLLGHSKHKLVPLKHEDLILLKRSTLRVSRNKIRQLQLCLIEVISISPRYWDSDFRAQPEVDRVCVVWTILTGVVWILMLRARFRGNYNPLVIQGPMKIYIR